MEGYNRLYDILTLGIPLMGIAGYLAWDWLYKKLEGEE
tara:strand:+ start:81 stop:194 length:114 start_codon:yes stop_codon:yes gene_type:complete